MLTYDKKHVKLREEIVGNCEGSCEHCPAERVMVENKKTGQSEVRCMWTKKVISE